MDQIKEFLTRRNIIALAVLLIIAVAIPVTIRLAQQTQIFKPKAAEGQFVTIAGKVTRADTGIGLSGVEVKIINGTENQKTDSKTTDSGGNFSISDLIKSNQLYAVRAADPPVTVGNVQYTGRTNTYENQTAGSGDCATACNFSYTPAVLDYNADLVGINFLDVVSGTSGPYDNAHFPGGLIQGRNYRVTITMKNSKKGNTQPWTSGFKLQYVGSDAQGLNINPTTIPVTRQVDPDRSFDFVTNIRPGAVQLFSFQWYIEKPDGTPFGAEINFLINAQAAVGGPGPSPSPSPSPAALCGECGTPIPGVSCDVSWNDNTSICRAKGSTRRNDKCIEKTCYPPSPLGQCGTCWGPLGSQDCTFDSTKCPPVEDPSKTICVVSGSRRGDCVAQGTPSPSPGTGFDFSINKPSDFTMTKGQSQVGKEFVVSKTAGSAEDVSFATNGNTGGAVAVFSPSGVCKPDPSICRRTVTFNTTNADPGDYSITIQGISTNGRVRESDPFNLKINPAGAVVTCFVVSENRNTRNLFKNCEQSVSDGIAGTIENLPQVADFQLSANNGNKTLYTRFLKLPVGESITTCTADKCKDTQAGITLNIAAPPSPSPSPPPVTGCVCQTNNGCSSSCQFTKLTGIDYGLPPGSGPIQCSLPAAIHNIVPTSQDKNSWCNRQLRTTGDADGNGVKDENDYLYWLTAVNLGKVPVSVNPDFDGDGQIDADDLNIWKR